MGKETVTDYKTVEEEKTVYYCDECGGTVNDEWQLKPIVGDAEIDVSGVDSVIVGALKNASSPHLDLHSNTYGPSQRRITRKAKKIAEKVTKHIEIEGDHLELCRGCYETKMGNATDVGPDEDHHLRLDVSWSDETDEDETRQVRQLYEKWALSLIASLVLAGGVAVLLTSVLGMGLLFAWGMVANAAVLAVLWMAADPR